jgi:hypothetical protein
MPNNIDRSEAELLGSLRSKENLIDAIDATDPDWFVTFNTHRTNRYTSDIYQQTEFEVMLPLVQKWQRCMQHRYPDIGTWDIWFELSDTGHIHAHAIWKEPVWKRGRTPEAFVTLAQQEWERVTRGSWDGKKQRGKRRKTVYPRGDLHFKAYRNKDAIRYASKAGSYMHRIG